jgi:cysteine-rich secretory family protein
MRKLWRMAAAVGVAAGPIVAVAAPAAAATADGGGESQFVALINQLRASKGLPGLAVNGQMTAQARAWSANMAANGLRENPNEASGAPAGWTVLGENVGSGSSVGDIEGAFVHSPAHYANLVGPRFNLVGVGVVVSNGALWVTQEFMAGPGGAAAPAARPVAVTPLPWAAPPPPAPPAPAPVAPPPPDELVRVLGELEAFDSGA